MHNVIVVGAGAAISGPVAPVIRAELITLLEGNGYEALNVKLTGHYRYYGIYGNYIGLQKYYKYACQELWKARDAETRPAG